uniref:TIL domain-containing protein n=1 Tax=Syphacia muris TaxID=451379 RepID=A0A0N5A8K3_9BILA
MCYGSSYKLSTVNPKKTCGMERSSGRAAAVYSNDTVVDRRPEHRHVYRFPDRDESSPLNCKANEYWLRCGPEKYCEKSCDNLNSPPNCHEELYHPKCYHPRCVCRKDFARNRDGFCVLKWNCPALIYNHDDTEIPQNRRIKQKRRRLY